MFGIDIGSLLHQILSANTFTAGAVALSLSAGILYYLREIPSLIWDRFLYFSSITVRLSNEDDLYELFKSWIDAHPYTKKTRHLRANLAWEYNESDDSHFSRLVFSPDVGDHFFFYKKRLVWIRSFRDKGVATNNHSDGLNMSLAKAKDRLEISARIFTQDKALIREFVAECQRFQEKQEKRSVRIFINRHSYWNMVSKKTPRDIDTVILKEGQMDSLLADISNFQGSLTWYKDMGIPYHRGYLLYGNPGSGKSSVASAIAGHLRTDIYILSLSDRSVDDSSLLELLTSVKNGSVILLEDIDAIFSEREGQDAKGVTFSGLINALDGAASKEGCLVFMSTNHLDRLDPALIRPGRADFKMELSDADPHQIEALYTRFFPGSKNVAKILEAFKDTNISMAELQERLIRHRNDEDLAIAHITEGNAPDPFLLPKPKKPKKGKKQKKSKKSKLSVDELRLTVGNLKKKYRPSAKAVKMTDQFIRNIEKRQD